MNKLAPVVIIHGMWSTPDTLDEIRAEFEDEGYTVHTPRLPNHYPRKEMTAERQRALATTSVNDYVQSVLEEIEQLDQAPILVGHSMGGLIAQLVAARTKIEKLILISCAPPAGINGWSISVVKTFGHNLLKFPLWKRTTNLLLKNIEYGIAQTQPPKTRNEIIRNSTYESGLASTEIGMWFLFRKPVTKVDYEAVECPVLIVTGADDRLTTLPTQYKIAQKYGSRATLKAVPGACHWTIGGTHLPKVREHIFAWLGHEKRLTEAA